MAANAIAAAVPTLSESMARDIGMRTCRSAAARASSVSPVPPIPAARRSGRGPVPPRPGAAHRPAASARPTGSRRHAAGRHRRRASPAARRTGSAARCPSTPARCAGTAGRRTRRRAARRRRPARPRCGRSSRGSRGRRPPRGRPAPAHRRSAARPAGTRPGPRWPAPRGSGGSRPPRPSAPVRPRSTAPSWAVRSSASSVVPAGDAEQRPRRVGRDQQAPDHHDPLGDHQPPTARAVRAAVGDGQVAEVVQPRVGRVGDLDPLCHQRAPSRVACGGADPPSLHCPVRRREWCR